MWMIVDVQRKTNCNAVDVILNDLMTEFSIYNKIFKTIPKILKTLQITRG